MSVAAASSQTSSASLRTRRQRNFYALSASDRRDPPAKEHGVNSEAGAASGAWKQPELPDRPSIAVLPFTSIGTDQESGYFAEGVADDIITELSRNKELFVVARHSSFRAAHEIDDYPMIGRALGVRNILTGSVRRASDRLRLSVHLIACATGKEVWAERYDRKLEDLFEVQLDVARTVTATIAGRLAALADAVSAAKPPDSFDAYDHVLRAQHYLQLYTQADYGSARKHLEKAIEADPGYARAYGLLCITGLYEWWFDMREGDWPRCWQSAKRRLPSMPTTPRPTSHSGWRSSPHTITITQSIISTGRPFSIQTTISLSRSTAGS